MRRRRDSEGMIRTLCVQWSGKIKEGEKRGIKKEEKRIEQEDDIIRTPELKVNGSGNPILGNRTARLFLPPVRVSLSDSLIPAANFGHHCHWHQTFVQESASLFHYDQGIRNGSGIYECLFKKNLYQVSIKGSE
jgi:hypothetical protein